VHFELCFVLMTTFVSLLAARGPLLFVLIQKVTKKSSQRNPCHYTGHTPGRVRWQAHASFKQQLCCATHFFVLVLQVPPLGEG
jgi:hypothetical protein